MVKHSWSGKLGKASLIFMLGSLGPLFTAAQPVDCNVYVLYAGSLAAVMENGVGPAFTKATGCKYQGEAQGSLGAAQMIHDHIRTPDVFISADPSVNQIVLMGPKNGDLVRWYSMLVSSELVVGYNPRSKFAGKFRDAADNKMAWYEVLATPGVRFGRGDPRIDPKGYRTLFLFALAGDHYHRPDIPKLLGDSFNPAQVLPEASLMAQLESGQFDAGVFYKHEAVAHKLPYISLPPEINFGDAAHSSAYARQSYTTPSGQHVTGAPILFTITIPETVQHHDGAVSFAKFLLSSDELLETFGFGAIKHQVAGDMNHMPTELRTLVEQASRQ